jgi:hypothetical protein
MRVSADALWFHLSFTLEPRWRPERTQAASRPAARLRDRLALALRRSEASSLDDLAADQLRDVGLCPDWAPPWPRPGRTLDTVRKAMVPF